jgi:hypothetical protein
MAINAVNARNIRALRSARMARILAWGGAFAPLYGDMKMKNGRRPRYADSAEIRPKVPGNPAREGTHSYACFEQALEAKTFGAYRLNGGDINYLYWFLDRGKLEIVG